MPSGDPGRSPDGFLSGENMRAKREKLGSRAYQLRKEYGYTWAVIARHERTKEHNVRKAAEDYAQERGLEWPLEMYSRGKMIYEMLVDGWTLLAIDHEINMEPSMAQKYARDYASRKGRQWPIISG